MTGNITKIQVNDVLKLQDGVITILEIWIDSPHMSPTAWVKYHYMTTLGREGIEENTIANFRKNFL